VLKKRGLPIYVFEDTDAEWTVKDEGGRVEQALEGSRLAGEADREVRLDLGARKSSFERNVERARAGKSENWGEEDPEDDSTPLGGPCKCVHGTCRDGDSTECSGSCEKGWKGKYCDIPEVSSS
jgi:hypothetical protein